MSIALSCVVLMWHRRRNGPLSSRKCSLQMTNVLAVMKVQQTASFYCATWNELLSSPGTMYKATVEYWKWYKINWPFITKMYKARWNRAAWSEAMEYKPSQEGIGKSICHSHWNHACVRPIWNPRKCISGSDPRTSIFLFIVVKAKWIWVCIMILNKGHKWLDCVHFILAYYQIWCRQWAMSLFNICQPRFLPGALTLLNLSELCHCMQVFCAAWVSEAPKPWQSLVDLAIPCHIFYVNLLSLFLSFLI